MKLKAKKTLTTMLRKKKSTEMKNKTYVKLQLNRDDNLIRTRWMLTDPTRMDKFLFFFFDLMDNG
jgi:hypothetical protein